jgi:hypothetical protein
LQPHGAGAPDELDAEPDPLELPEPDEVVDDVEDAELEDEEPVPEDPEEETLDPLELEALVELDWPVLSELEDDPLPDGLPQPSTRTSSARETAVAARMGLLPEPAPGSHTRTKSVEPTCAHSAIHHSLKS